MDRFKLSKWKVVLGAQDRVNIPCFMHDTRICQSDFKMTTSTEPTRHKYKTCQDIKTGVHIRQVTRHQKAPPRRDGIVISVPL